MSYRNGTGVLLFREDGRFLLQQRGRGCGEGHWSVPGGRQERGEQMHRTAIREVREEVNVRIITIRHILAGKRTHLITRCVHPCCGGGWDTYWYQSRDWVGTPEPSEEATKLFWASWDDMPKPLWDVFGDVVDRIQSCLIS